MPLPKKSDWRDTYLLGMCIVSFVSGKFLADHLNTQFHMQPIFGNTYTIPIFALLVSPPMGIILGLCGALLMMASLCKKKHSVARMWRIQLVTVAFMFVLIFGFVWL